MRKLSYRTAMNGNTECYALSPYRMTRDAWRTGNVCGFYECRLCQEAGADKEKRTTTMNLFGHGGKAVFQLVSPKLNPTNPEEQRICGYIKENLELLNQRPMVPPNWRLTGVEYGKCPLSLSLGTGFDLTLKFCVQLPEHLQIPGRRCLTVEVVLDRKQSDLPLELDFHTDRVWDSDINTVCMQFHDDLSVWIAECKDDIVVRSLSIDAPTIFNKLDCGTIDDNGELVSSLGDIFGHRVGITVTEYIN